MPKYKSFFNSLLCAVYFIRRKKVLLCLLGTGLIVDIILNSLYLICGCLIGRELHGNSKFSLKLDFKYLAFPFDFELL